MAKRSGGGSAAKAKERKISKACSIFGAMAKAAKMAGGIAIE